MIEKEMTENELPAGWMSASLDEIRPSNSPIIYGILQPGPDLKDGIRYVRPTEISGDEIQVDRLRKTSPEIAKKYARASLQSNDLIFTIVGTIGKVALVPPELQGANITQSSARIRPEGSIIDPLYLKFSLKSPALTKQCDDFKMGTAVPRLNLEDVRKLRVALAPLAEQKRIAGKLKTVLGRVDTCRARLDRIPVILRRFRQSVLAAATSGKLTEEWKEGRTTEDWQLLKVSDVGSVQLGRQRSPKYHHGENMRPYLRVQNVFEARLDLSDVMKMEFSEADFKRYKLSYGDILLNEGQSPQYLGRPAMFRDELPGACFTNSLIRFRAKLDILDREYALLVFRHYMHSGRFAQEGSITTNIAHLSAGKFANIEFLLPPLPEQQQIVRRVEALFAMADRIEARLATAQKTIQRLTPATLAKAFRGELVPQDPNDEPAGKLLESIKNRVATQPPKSNPRLKSKR